MSFILAIVFLSSKYINEFVVLLNCSKLPTDTPLEVFPLIQLKLVKGYVSKKFILDESVISKNSLRFFESSKSEDILIDLLDMVSILKTSLAFFTKLSKYSVLYKLLIYVCQLSPFPSFDIFFKYDVTQSDSSECIFKSAQIYFNPD